ncbi:MAG: DUF1992 domain-containing protein [Planctomycetota bacterium]
MRDHEKHVERLIREAQERGEFDNLPGAGKPIPGLDKPHDELWWLKQLLEREQISLAPATLELRKKVEEALDRTRRARTEEEVRRLVLELNAEIAKANARASSGPPTDLAPLDAEDAVRRWRARLS